MTGPIYCSIWAEGRKLPGDEAGGRILCDSVGFPTHPTHAAHVHGRGVGRAVIIIEAVFPLTPVQGEIARLFSNGWPVTVLFEFGDPVTFSVQLLDATITSLYMHDPSAVPQWTAGFAGYEIKYGFGRQPVLSGIAAQVRSMHSAWVRAARNLKSSAMKLEMTKSR